MQEKVTHADLLLQVIVLIGLEDEKVLDACCLPNTTVIAGKSLQLSSCTIYHMTRCMGMHVYAYTIDKKLNREYADV